MTSIVPFSPPRSCSTTWAGSGGEISVGVRCASGTLVDDAACLPAATATITACPVDWTAVVTANSITTCCPNDFPIHSNGGVCYSTAGGFILSGVTCAPSASPTGVQKTYGFTPGVWAKAVSYVGTSTPSQTSSTASLTITSSATTSGAITSGATTLPPPSTSSTIPTSTPAASQPDRRPKKKLGGGAIAGIVIGVIVAVVLILAAIFMIRKRRQKSKETIQNQTMADQSNGYYAEKSELESASRAELDAGSKGQTHLQRPPPDVRLSELASNEVHAHPMYGHEGKR